MKVNRDELAFIILIGGKSSRFGTDKGIFEFLGTPLIMYQLETLVKFDYNIFLIANSQEQVQKYINKIDYEKIMGFILDDLSLIHDLKIRTPMIGLYTVFKELKKIGYKKVLAMSCDTPLIKYSVIDLIINEIDSYECVIPQWKNGFLEPLLAVYPIDKAFYRAEESLKNKEYKLLNLLDKNWKINYLSIEDKIQPLDKNLISFVNINGPIDIQKLIKIYKQNNN